MTIADAETLVREQGPSFLKDYESWLRTVEEEVIRSDKRPGPLPIENHVATLGWSAAIMENTNRSFNMLTGSDHLVRILGSQFRQMLRRIVSSGGHAKVIVVDGTEKEFLQAQSDVPNVLEVLRAESRKPIRHYFIGDDRFAYDEEIHPPITREAPADIIHGELHVRRAIPEVLNKRFNVAWEWLTKK